MALFGLLRPQTVSDPILGVLTRSRRYWRCRVSLDAQHDVPLLIAGGRKRPDDQAVALGREVPSRYLALQGAIGAALFEHYLPYREAIDAGETYQPDVRLADASEVWPNTTPVHIVVAPLDGRLSVEIGYRTRWDIEHTLGAILVDWQLVELNGSVLGLT